ncbi:MAG TPA: hypothetical protein VFR15_19565 [Chloroflexia bacterium]|nr:hypothetical protein [Chloroflexia bacterium]
MKRSLRLNKWLAAIMAALLLLGSTTFITSAKGKPPGGEAATNNLSYPVIFPDGKPTNWLEVDSWLFAQVDDLTTCVTEEGVPVGSPVPLDILCYYARQNLGIDEETGERIWVGESTLWWLQERAQNRWQVYDPVVNSPVVVTAVDFGDLLESTSQIKQKQIRTEVSLLQVVDEALLTTLGAQLWADGLYADFGWANQPVFGALKMSGAVPGTDQSINEIQGTDYGTSTGLYPGSGTMINPRTVKTDSASGLGFDATVYGNNAHFVIQRITSETPTLAWDPVANRWTGDVSDPVVNLHTSDGSYSAEINAGGSVIYGYNWSTKQANDGNGIYRLTFVLESGSNTQFTSSTLLANPGNINPGHVVAGATVGEAGLAYVDVNVRVR